MIKDQIMEITERTTADIVTLSLSGRLDSTTAKTFEDTILGRIESGDRRLVIDLSQLDYISSAGLRVFALAGKRLKNANGKLVLCAFKKTIPYNTLNRIPDPVREVFDTSGFSLIFPTYGSHDDAIEALQA
jgi:anti-anti-sigma factor